MDHYSVLRERMVKDQIEARGVADKRVLEAMLSVPRHLFVPEDLRGSAYQDSPLPIGEGQTISQPYMVALMTELLHLKGDEKVLEVGTGSGYQAAVLSLLAAEVFTIEKNERLASKAAKRLKDMGFDNVYVIVGDGTLGLKEEAPFDGIIVTAGSPSIPQPLTEQLKIGGRLVIPVGPSGMQMLKLIVRMEDRFIEEEKGGCVFVPLVGKHGWKSGHRFAN